MSAVALDVERVAEAEGVLVRSLTARERASLARGLSRLVASLDD
jgi:hypothetical protein